MPQEPTQGARRYLKTRDKAWAKKLAAWLARIGVSPNVISMLSLVFAIVGAVCIMKVSEYPSKACATLIWAFAAICIQLRLLCNLLDGMVAIEGGRQSPLGPLFNEVPDRLADPILLMAAGYCNDWVVKVGDIPVGWVAAVLSVLTAYIRVLGGTLTGTQSFIGPMAKQHRMAVLTLACLGSIVELWVRKDAKWAEGVMKYALTTIAVGCVITCFVRLCVIARQLRERAQAQ
jgi:phosphatidylglycerophosphate synthase